MNDLSPDVWAVLEEWADRDEWIIVGDCAMDLRYIVANLGERWSLRFIGSDCVGIEMSGDKIEMYVQSSSDPSTMRETMRAMVAAEFAVAEITAWGER